MKAAYNARAPKRPVNLFLNEDLVAQARTMTGNLSAEVESLLAAYVQQQRQLRDAEAESLRLSVAAWNAWADRHGSFADEFSTL
ncbi:MAG: type II toxin-antitoxin system CcdA family antitoxin [Solimonas sp.]